MDPQNLENYGGVEHVNYCLQVYLFSLRFHVLGSLKTIISKIMSSSPPLPPAPIILCLIIMMIPCYFSIIPLQTLVGVPSKLPLIQALPWEVSQGIIIRRYLFPFLVNRKHNWIRSL
jgi:hypothetical protein